MASTESLGDGYFHSWCPSPTDQGPATENTDRVGRSVGARAAPAAPHSRYRPTEVSFFTKFQVLELIIAKKISVGVWHSRNGRLGIVD